MVDCEADESGNIPCCCFEDDDVTELLEWVDASNGQIPRGAVKVAFPTWVQEIEWQKNRFRKSRFRKNRYET